MGTIRALSRGLGEKCNNSSDSTEFANDFEEFATERFPLFAAIVALVTIILIVLSFVLRGYCYRRWGLNICPGSLPEARRHEVRQDQISSAQRRRRRQDRPSREESSMVLQAERRSLYEIFLQPFSKTLTSQDFLSDSEHSSTRASDCSLETDSTLSPEKWIRIPDATAADDRSENHDEKARTVSAHCAICLQDCSPGEAIVWSTVPGCPHAFHRDCMICWLCTGKKRCPTCRKWFVPGERIADLKRRISQSQNGDVVVDTSRSLPTEATSSEGEAPNEQSSGATPIDNENEP